MNLVFFIMGFLIAALLGMCGLMAVLILRARKPPDGIPKEDFERQLGNLLRYNGTSVGQKGGRDDGSGN